MKSLNCVMTSSSTPTPDDCGWQRSEREGGKRGEVERQRLLLSEQGRCREEERRRTMAN